MRYAADRVLLESLDLTHGGGYRGLVDMPQACFPIWPWPRVRAVWAELRLALKRELYRRADRLRENADAV